ncbi:hypothetical protein G6694_09645 [Polynucleobacter paneuropaeus]|nr:hypothetical protein [Polynucleobacter paneuropaeus]
MTALANGLTHWQTLNGQYVIPLQIIITLLTLYWPSRYRLQSRFLFAAPILIGLFIGTAGTSLSLSFIIFAGLVMCWSLHENKKLRDGNYFWIYLLGSIMLGVIFCHLLSPGSILRAKTLNLDSTFSIGRISSLMQITFIEGFKEWFRSSFSLASLVCISLASGFSYFICSIQNKSYPTKTWRIAALFGIFALLQCFVNHLADELTYRAYWHYVDSLVCIFISLVLFGLWIGSFLATKKFNWRVNGVISLLMMIMFVIGIRANIVMVNKIQLRHQQWVVGGSSDDGISDINGQSGWEMACWEKLNSLRSEPIIRGSD